MTQPVDPIEAARRFEQFFQLCDLNMELAEAGVRHDYPHATQDQVRKILSERFSIIRNQKWKGYGPICPPQA